MKKSAKVKMSDMPDNKKQHKIACKKYAKHLFLKAKKK